MWLLSVYDFVYRKRPKQTGKIFSVTWNRNQKTRQAWLAILGWTKCTIEKVRSQKKKKRRVDLNSALNRLLEDINKENGQNLLSFSLFVCRPIGCVYLNDRMNGLLPQRGGRNLEIDFALFQTSSLLSSLFKVSTVCDCFLKFIYKP